MALNTLFPRAKELVNYDYFDIADGTGYVVYYGAQGDNEEYFMTTNSNLYSERIATSKQEQTLTGTLVKHFDIDFDLTFNRPKNIKGSIFANIPIGSAAVEDTSKTIECQTIVKAIHYDGSTETVLATGTSEALSANNHRTSQRAYASNIMMCHMDVTALKHFKKGETLRFTVEGYYRVTSGSGDVQLIIGHDPQNRAWQEGKRMGTEQTTNQLANEPLSGGTITYQNTQMIFHVPFVLDV